MSRKTVPYSDGELSDLITRLEQRVSRLEAAMNLDTPAEELPAETVRPDPVSDEETEEEFELQVGQNWFAKAGIVLLSLGIMFLLAFPYQDVPSYVPSLVGFVLGAAMMRLSSSWQRSYEQVAGYLSGGGMVVFFFSVLRLSYFTLNPAMENREVTVLLLLAVVAFNLVVAARRDSPLQLAMNLALGFAAAGITTEPYAVFAVITAGAVVSVFMFHRFRNPLFLFTGIPFAYGVHFLWGIGNPLIGNDFSFVTGPQSHFLFLVIYAMIFGMSGLLGSREKEWRGVELALALCLGACFSGVFLLLSLAMPGETVYLWHALASVAAMGLAVAYWVKRKSRYATFVFSMLGYMALSAAIVSRFTIVDSFVWLCWQSVIVLSTAVWFHSRFIVVANFFIYLSIFLAYLVSDVALTTVSVSFGVVALLSARILNWQRDRLELKTEMMRNAYLVCALLFLPYALYHILQAEFVSLSWLGLAFSYYLASRLLNARKYRWMALMTMVLAIVHVFLVDLVGLDPTLRIISFVVLGIALLGVSMFYTKGRTARGTPDVKLKDTSSKP